MSVSTDRIQGMFRQDVAAAVGDIILKRRDQLFAYVLAVVVDDAAQGVTHIVRGADLLDNTPRQIILQRLLGLPQPGYAHVPVLTEPDDSKLAKSRAQRSAATRTRRCRNCCRVFSLLGLVAARFAAHGASSRKPGAGRSVNGTSSYIPKRLQFARKAHE